jgi:hypothetical protein
VAFIVLILSANPARADTDQACLRACIEGGGNEYTCLPTCAYNTPQTPSKPLSHNVLKAPEPVEDIVLPPPSSAKTKPSDMDYACLTQCLQNGMQYQLCRQNCAKETGAVPRK